VLDLSRLTAPSTTTPVRLPSAPDPADSPLGQLLLHPGATLGRWVQEFAELLWQLARHPLLFILAATMLLCVPAVAWLAGRRRQARLARGARWVQILPPPVVEPPAAEALWANLSGLLRSRRWLWDGGRTHVAFELRWSIEGLTIGLWVPGIIAPRVIERAVEAAWPGARTDTSAAGPPLPVDRPMLGGTLRLAEMELLPLRTEHWVDPLRALLGAAGELAAGEAACVQVLARPASAGAARRLWGGPGAGRLAAASVPRRAVGVLLDLLTPGHAHAARSRRGARPADPTRAADTRAMLAKTQGPAWQVCVRYGVAAGHDPDTLQRRGRTGRRGHQGRLRARAHALAAAFEVHSGRNRLARQRLRRPAVALASRRFTRRAGGLLSATELATLAHLPVDLAVPGLTRAGARPVAPAPAAPTQGKILGDAEIGPRRPVALTPAAARQHLHLIGATGSGKSTLICNLALDDIANGRGVVVIDPKGDLVGDLLERLPEPAHERLVLLDPDEADAPPAMNVLEGRDPDLVVDHLVGILHRIWHAYWGPRIDDVLRASCLTLLRRPGATLAEVPRLLADAAFRRPYLHGLDDPVGLGGFWAWYEGQSPASQAQIVGPIMTRLRAFLMRPFVRAVVGSASSSFDMADVLDGGICLVRVPKGQLGDETSRLLGSFVLARVWQAATARARLPQADRVDAVLYADEAHNFLTLPYQFDEMFAEARGYGLGLALAHQHLAQLPTDLARALSANARSKLFFTLSPEDARELERHTTPELRAHDLAHLGQHQAALRLFADGRELPACTIHTRPAPPPVPGRARAARATARAHHGRTAAQRRAEQLRRHLSADDPRLRHPSSGAPGSNNGLEGERR
jgi:Type IV secretion-system coupling protein DNA-binding domain